MRILVIGLLLVSAHFSATAFVPTNAGKGWIGWPFAADSAPLLALFGRPQDGLTAALAGIAVLGFLGGTLGLFGKLVQPQWWAALVIAAAVASAVLYAAYFSPRSLLPIALDALILWGVLAQGWTIAGLRG